VDVGGPRKGFDVAILRADREVEGPVNIKDPLQVVDWLSARAPRVVAVDSPRSTASPGQTHREGERELARSQICRIRWTPDADTVFARPYYSWIVNGLKLYDLLLGFGEWDVIEVFPTASWTRWFGTRGTKRRARWTSDALTLLSLSKLPPRRLNQDDRDAIAAALTAQEFERGQTEYFGEIVVPTARWRPDASSVEIDNPT
jgi:predicted nuclease with RNAse H fold